jgi:transposase
LLRSVNYALSQEVSLPAKRLSIRKVREVLRLKYGVGMGSRQIAQGCSISHATVHEYLKRTESAGIKWPLDAKWTDIRLEKALFRRSPTATHCNQPLPDFGNIFRRLQTDHSLTLQDLWQEWRQHHPRLYSYSRYCALYQNWRDGENDRAGERLFVYWADMTVPLYDRRTGGGVMEASIFVAVLGASHYTFVRAAPDRTLRQWIGCQMQALDSIRGSPVTVVYDKSGLDKASRYEPELNRTYQEFAEHYGVAVVPGRPRSPGHTARIGTEIKTAHAPIISALRSEKFFSLTEVNEAIADVVEWWNLQPFRDRQSRRSLYEEFDLPALRPLPRDPLRLAEWRRCRASLDYHVEIAGHYYSVPYELASQQLEARYTEVAVEVFHQGERVALHRRSFIRHQHTTNDAHMPPNHLAHLVWTPARLVEWGETVGNATGALIRAILKSRPHPEMAYRSCIGVLRLAKTHTPERVEAACRQAVKQQACSYQAVRSILSRSVERQAAAEPQLQEVGPPQPGSKEPARYEQTRLF